MSLWSWLGIYEFPCELSVVLYPWAGCLIEQLTEEKYECMVCCEVIRVMAPVWSCQNCFHVFHLNCIKKWARSPASQADGKSTNPCISAALYSVPLNWSLWRKSVVLSHRITLATIFMWMVPLEWDFVSSWVDWAIRSMHTYSDWEKNVVSQMIGTRRVSLMLQPWPILIVSMRKKEDDNYLILLVYIIGKSSNIRSLTHTDRVKSWLLWLFYCSCVSHKMFWSVWLMFLAVHVDVGNCAVCYSTDGSEGWRCPACQHVAFRAPNSYTCFCGENSVPPQQEHLDFALERHQLLTCVSKESPYVISICVYSSYWKPVSHPMP